MLSCYIYEYFAKCRVYSHKALRGLKLRLVLLLNMFVRMRKLESLVSVGVVGIRTVASFLNTT